MSRRVHDRPNRLFRNARLGEGGCRDLSVRGGLLVDPAEMSRPDETVIGVAFLFGADALAEVMTPSDLIGLTCAVMATLTAAICSTFYRLNLCRYGIPKVSAFAMAASLVPWRLHLPNPGATIVACCSKKTILQ